MVQCCVRLMHSKKSDRAFQTSGRDFATLGRCSVGACGPCRATNSQIFSTLRRSRSPDYHGAHSHPTTRVNDHATGLNDPAPNAPYQKRQPRLLHCRGRFISHTDAAQPAQPANRNNLNALAKSSSRPMSAMWLKRGARSKRTIWKSVAGQYVKSVGFVAVSTSMMVASRQRKHRQSLRQTLPLAVHSL